MAQPLATPYSYFADANGAPLAGGKIYTYAAGTTTQQNSYTDSTATIPLSNPVILDSAGRATIWLSGFYKIVVTDANNVTISTTDNITALGSTGDMNKSVYDPNNIQEQLVGLSAVQTLSNKTFTAPITTGASSAPPNFEVYRSTNQSFITGTPTKINYDLVISDPNSYWDGTNHRWVPLVAGKYSIALYTYFSGSSTAGQFVATYIYLNGAPRNFGIAYPPAITTNNVGSCTAIADVIMNGTTDYIEGWVNANITAPIINGGGTPYLTYMCAHRIGA